MYRDYSSPELCIQDIKKFKQEENIGDKLKKDLEQSMAKAYYNNWILPDWGEAPKKHKETTVWEAGLIKKETMKTIAEQIDEMGLGVLDEGDIEVLKNITTRFIILPSRNNPEHYSHKQYTLIRTDNGAEILDRSYGRIVKGYKRVPFLSYEYPETSFHFQVVLPKKEQPTVQEQLITLGMQEGDLVVLDGYPGTFLVVTECNTPFIRVGDLNVTGINARSIKVKKAFRLDRNEPNIRYTETGIRQEYREIEVD